MVTGLNIFRDYFVDDTDKYVLIGGAACDIVLKAAGNRRVGNGRLEKRRTLDRKVDFDLWRDV